MMIAADPRVRCRPTTTAAPSAPLELDGRALFVRSMGLTTMRSWGWGWSSSGEKDAYQNHQMKIH